ncbi:hypothetical protein JSY31_23900, partial [Xenorhabdus bovienii]|nr:hypothetical protein [Xenorhabdus bovienii]MDE9533156.1 hypothetical protein [Xenorhabdus bovienii]
KKLLTGRINDPVRIRRRLPTNERRPRGLITGLVHQPRTEIKCNACRQSLHRVRSLGIGNIGQQH